MRLVGEIYSSDVIMHRGYSRQFQRARMDKNDDPKNEQ